MSGRSTSVSSFLRKPLVLMVLVGLLIRLVLMPILTYDFDMYHWALIISNINSGHGLYELDGYYYTPVWGYFMGTISMFQGFLTDGLLGIRSTDMLPIEVMNHRFHIATITTISFNVLMKIPMIICDLAVGYLIYWLVKDRTGDKKKAATGFGLWFFCPIVIYMSAVQGMFDTISALLLLLTVITLYKDKCLVCGMMFAAAVLLKFFPLFCIFVLISYIIVKHRDDGLAKRKVLEAVIGAAVMSAVLMLPLIINGQVGDALTFITGRTGEGGWGVIFTLADSIIVVMASLLFGYLMYRKSAENADKYLFIYTLLAITASATISVTPQYVIVVIPFLILFILSEDRSYIRCWIVIGVAAFLGAFLLNNYSLFCSLAVHTDLVSPGWVIDGMHLLETEVFGVPLILGLTSIVNVFQFIGLLLVFAFYFADVINERFPRLGRIILRIKGTEVHTDET